MLQKKSASSYQTVLQEKIPEEISITAFGFTSGCSINIKNQDYSTKVVISPVGRIRQTVVEIK